MSLNGMVKTKTDGDEGESRRKKGSPPPLGEQPQALSCCNNSRAEAEVEVFSSSALIRLVKIMHPYCLKLHVEEGERRSTRHAFFSQEQVWKYESPKEGSDEEINVVSDDDERPEEKTFLRSLLRNEKSPRKRKRVSFGAVQVSSFEESLQARLCEKNQTNTGEAASAGAKAVPGSLQGAQNVSPHVRGKNTGVVPLKKAKSLSLQQYRQRQQARAPLVEQPGNYTSKWPSVPGTPQQLTPILSLQGPNTHDASPRSGPTTPASDLRACLDLSRVKRCSAESGISSPHGLLAAPAGHLRGNRRPQKKPPVSSDPPNPVVVALPGSHRWSSSDCSLDRSGWKQAESSGRCVQLQHSSSPPQDWAHAELAQGASGASECSGTDPDPDTRHSEPPEQIPGLESPPFSGPTSAGEAEEQRQTEADRKGASEAPACPGSECTLQSSSAASGKHLPAGALTLGRLWVPSEHRFTSSGLSNTFG